MRRRQFLALAGVVGAAGCTGARTDPSVERTVTPAPVPTARTGPDPDATDSVAVTASTVQPGVVGPRSPDSIGVFDDAGQYLVVYVEGDAPDRADIEFRFDGTGHAPEPAEPGLYRGGNWGVTYGPKGGLLAFGLPETGGGDAGLVWPDGEWRPPPSVRDRLEAPLPPFAVSLSGTGGSDPRLSIGVTNEGARAGRYVLALNRQGPRIASTPVSRIVGELTAGASETVPIDAVAPVGDAPTRYTLGAAGRETELTHVISTPGTETA